MATLEEIQGNYEITYQSTPQLPNWYEIGTGNAKIQNDNLTGADGLGVLWNAKLFPQPDGTINFQAVLDPRSAPPTVGLIDKQGMMTRNPQHYEGVVKVTKVGDMLVLRTTVIQGPLTINVQFKKVT